MAYQLVWTAEAENDFKNIILYLKENWSIQSAQKFVNQTYKELEKLLITYFYLTKSNNVAVKTPRSLFLKIAFQFPL